MSSVGSSEWATRIKAGPGECRTMNSIEGFHVGPRVRLYCKGADNVIYSRLAKGQLLEQYTQPHLAEMSRAGLRTLCIAQRDISPEEYEVQTVIHTTNDLHALHCPA